MDKMVAGHSVAAWKKSGIGALVGAIVGAGTVAGLMHVAGTDFIDAMGGSRVALAGVAILYLLMAAFVGFGLAAPRTGARLLNVADADELREERAGMGRSVIVMSAIGAALLALALARTPSFPTGPVPAQAAAAVLALVIAGGVAASWAWRRQYDELNRQLGIEGGYWAFGLSWIGLTLWGAADFMGLGPALTAIDVVTTLAAMMLVGAFVAIGRRGLMMR